MECQHQLQKKAFAQFSPGVKFPQPPKFTAAPDWAAAVFGRKSRPSPALASRCIKWVGFYRRRNASKLRARGERMIPMIDRVNRRTAATYGRVSGIAQVLSKIVRNHLCGSLVIPGKLQECWEERMSKIGANSKPQSALRMMHGMSAWPFLRSDFLGLFCIVHCYLPHLITCFWRYTQDNWQTQPPLCKVPPNSKELLASQFADWLRL